TGEMRLLCLDPPKATHGAPTVSWRQTLANVNNKLLLDVGRRIQTASLAYGEGILVCPTNAGAVFGVDLLSHSLVWAYSYREDTPKGGDHQQEMRRRNMWMGMQSPPNLNPDWKTAPPVIQEGKVVLTAPDGSGIHCVNLRKGTRVWRATRTDDIYLGGVYNGKVVLVGKDNCRALKLADGK